MMSFPNVVKTWIKRPYLRNLTHFDPWVRRYGLASILTPQTPHCKACGTEIQTSSPEKFGFYQPPKPRINFVDNKYNEIYDLLSPEDRKLLLIQDAKTTKTRKLPKVEAPILDPNTVRCTKCHDAIYHDIFDEKLMIERKFEDVMTSIPAIAPVVHVVSAIDFPLTVNPMIFQFRDPKHVHVVVTKLDLFFNSGANCSGMGNFFKQYINVKFGVPMENVHIVLGTRNWNIAQLLNSIPDDAYLLGEANTGKSTLIGSLHYIDDKIKRRNEYLEKLKERNMRQVEQIPSDINVDFVEVNEFGTAIPLKKVRMREAVYQTQFKNKNSPAISFLPGFTQKPIKYELPTTQKTVFDVPGFEVMTKHGIFQWMRNQGLLKESVAGANFQKNGTFSSKYESFHGPCTISLGGFYYLEVPDRALLQIRNNTNASLFKFSDMARAKNVISRAASNEAFVNRLKVLPELVEKVVEYGIPPFFGAVDLVLKGIGHINIKPVGVKRNTEPFLVKAIPGAELVIRKPIEHYITRFLSGRDLKGKLLPKAKWMESTKEAKKYSGEVFTSKLVRIPDHVEDKGEYIKLYCKEYNHIGPEEGPVKQDQLANRYWLELHKNCK